MKERRCPITYELIPCDQKYSINGLRLLSFNLKTFSDLPFNEIELRHEAVGRAQKMSIQGVQPKLSARLNIQNNRFDIVDSKGEFILKPALDNYPEVPANEDLTMRMAKFAGIEVPLHGLIYNKDQTLTYFIQRFDRLAGKKKCSVEDFAQLSNHDRNTKYQFSMEKLIPIIDQHCTFPLIAKQQLFVRVLFNYLMGNEDMHLKNFSLITRKNKTELAPAYDFLNTSILIPHVKEEMALPLRGKKSRFCADDLIQYYGCERLSLNPLIIHRTVKQLMEKLPVFLHWIDISFLSGSMKLAYKNLLLQRMLILQTKI